MSRSARRCLRVLALSLLVSGSTPGEAQPARSGPLAFEPNHGQTHGQVEYLARGDGYALFLTPTEMVLVLRPTGAAGADAPARVLRFRLDGAAAAPRISGEEELPGRSHYLVGDDPARWRTGVPRFARVRYDEVYPGTDLVFYGRDRQLEHDFVLGPGADPAAVCLAVRGADRLEIGAAGDLVMSAGGAEVRLRKPFSYQEADGGRREVASGWRLLGGGEAGERRVGFQVGDYDRSRTLVIDPVLAYSTYLGGGELDWGEDIAIDAAGNAYVGGMTTSVDFPLAGALNPVPRPTDAFVAKLDPTGALVYSTYLGGAGADHVFGLAVDAASSAYVTGETYSFDFPEVQPLPLQQRGTRNSVFVTKLSPSGAALVYSTRLGGSGFETGWDIGVDALGQAYVTGSTDSPDFPAVRAVQPGPRGGVDGFVAKLSAQGSALLYSTYLGGSGTETGRGIAVDASGRAWVAGDTSSPNLPTVLAARGSLAGPSDGFVARLTALGSLLILTYLGGSRDDAAWDVAVDAGGNGYVTGYTHSPDFPLVRPAQRYAGDIDGFVSRLSPAGVLNASTYIGGSRLDFPTAIAVERHSGIVYLTGRTNSADFPLRDPIQTECRPDPDVPLPLYCDDHGFVTGLDLPYARLVYSTYLGGMRPTNSVHPREDGRGIAVDQQRNVYVTGLTPKDDFPTVQAVQPAYAGGLHDAFVAKLAPGGVP